MKTILITGGSRGIGAACAIACASARLGGRCQLRARRAPLPSAWPTRCGRPGCRRSALQADVSDEDQVLAMFARIDAELPPLHGLVNNAGIVDRQARVDEFTLARIRRMFEINVFGSILCAREAVRRISTRHGGAGGSIVNLSSVAATLGSPGLYVDYAASKGAIDSFTVGLAREVATEGIRVNAVRPGIIDTEIHASGGQPDRAHQSLAMIPMRRVGRAEEIAEAVCWLLEDTSSYTTGGIIDVSGGR